MKNTTFFLLLIIVWACKNNEPAVNNLVGNWKLVSYCKSTGGSSCTPVVVPADKGVFISFGNDGKFDESYFNTKPLEYGFLGCGGGSYSIEGTDVRIIATCMSSSNGKLFPIASISSQKLTLIVFDKYEYVFEKQ